jgi:type IV pilus assembly protein PilM
LPAPPHVFSIDERRIRYARLGRQDGDLELQEYRAADLPEDTFLAGPLGGPLRDPGGFAAFLEGFFSELSSRPERASLVLPDDWLRITFTELDDLPRSTEASEEVVRWKLRRLVPFRVEELRVVAGEVPTLEGQSEAHRLMVGFAVEQLMSQLEEAFAEGGVWLGQIANATLSTAPAVESDLDSGLAVLALVRSGGYTLLFTFGGDPALYRSKQLRDGLGGRQLLEVVQRDLRLTQAFLGEHFSEGRPQRLLLVAERTLESRWREWLAEGLGVAAEPVDYRHLPLQRAAAPLNWIEVAPMIGAASREIP